MQDTSALPTKLLILVSLLQGLALLFLHQAIEFKFWPHSSPEWLFCFYSMAFVAPIMLLLGLTKGKTSAVVKWVIPFALASGLLGYYIGYQSTPLSHVRYDTLLLAFVSTLGIAVFKALMYVQQFVSGEKFSYSNLFRWSWRNFFTVALSLLFALCFWGILMLWAGLFKAIKVDFFYDLFTEPWFYYPAVSLAHGFGVIIFRNLSNVIDTITRLQQALMKFLLVLLVLISILFLGALPFTGLTPLWETGGSALILWMQAIMLFFINAVYQDDSASRPYTIWLHRFIYFGVAILPIYSLISAYGLSLRIAQYGWTLERCWAVTIWLLLAWFSAGYLWGIIKYRDNWLYQLSKVNVAMGLVVLAVMLLVNSPLVDFRKISVHSQLNRLQNEIIGIDDFDIQYFRYKLARPGYEALEKIKAKYAQSNPELVVRISSLYSDRDINKAGFTEKEFLAMVKMVSGEMPAEVGKQLYEDISTNTWAIQNTKHFYLLPLDLNNDSLLEYLYIEEHDDYSDMNLYYFEDKTWKHRTISRSDGKQAYDQNFFDAVRSGSVEILAPKWQDLKIGDYELQVN